MKYKALYSIIALGAALAASCDKSGIVSENSEPGINLTVSTGCPAVAEVKASSTMPDPRNGEDAYNENLLNSFYYFFYPNGTTSAEPAISGFVAGLSTTGEAQTRIPASAATISNVLFNSSNTCQMFIVANPPEELVPALTAASGRSLAEIRSLVIMSTMSGTQDNFIMVYDGPVEISSLAAETAIDVSVGLDRLAAKFTLGAYVSPSITDPDDPQVIYTPGAEGINVTFCNGLNRTTLGGFDKTVLEEGDFFDSDVMDLGTPSDKTLDSENYKYFHSSTPFYTYPMEWAFTSKNEPYLLYEMHWDVKKNGSTVDYNKPLYYKLTLGSREINSNEWYDIAAKLTVLGSLYPEDPTEIFSNMTYTVLSWKSAYEGTAPNTSADIKDTRYLSVPQTEWVLNNKEEVIIPFSSSHDCIVENLSATKTSFHKTSGDYGEHTTVTVTSSVSTQFPDAKGQLKITRALNNTLGSSSMDISPVNISLRIRHSDNAGFYSDITITQYPAIWVDTQQNSAGQDGSSNCGYILIDGTRNSNSGSISNARGAEGSITTDSNNTSRWFTIIHVNQFDQASNTENFVVGDPRKAEYDNLTDLWSYISGNPRTVAQATRKYGNETNATLAYYRPTIPARSGEENSRKLFVAPAFRVCTAHCKNGEDNTYPEAMLRCATYQEDGYPAGRWRLPTYAEIKLFRMLSSASLIPNLFYNSGKYTYAGGMCTGTTFTDGIKANTTDMGACRCVYDEWYWSQVDAEFGWDNSNKTTFYWGDIPTNYNHPSK